MTGILEQRFGQTSSHSLDDKGRLRLPPRFAVSPKEEFVVTGSKDFCLRVMSRQTFDAEVEALQARAADDEFAEMELRFVQGHAEPVVVDANQRITVSDGLRRFARIDTSSKVWVIGRGGSFEIWSDALWTSFLEVAMQRRRSLFEVSNSVTRSTERADSRG